MSQRFDQKPPVEPPLPPILFPGANSTERRYLAELKRSERIRSVGPRLYVSVPEAQTAAVLRGSWSTIVARLFPDALVTHRTSLEFRPSPEGEVFITGSSNREVRYPGLALRFIKGPGPLPDDPPFITIRTSSQARAFLENLSKGRRSGSRVMPLEELEKRLERILHVGGEAEINRLRDRAREIAELFRWTAEFKRLDALIGTLLGTRTSRVTSDVARARAAGEPFDAAYLERMQLLFAELRGPLPALRDTFAALDHKTNKAFFDAYFSNYIEGTTFEIEEAERIVFDKQIPANRPRDAHDIASTFAITSNQAELARTASTFDELVAILKSRHATIMEQRPETSPGQFKTGPNRAGETRFVHPEYVVGTLRKGWELHQTLPPGLARAIFVAFLISEVHPFVDGNGRISRLMMNSELAASGQPTIIIPTVFRDDYLHALRALSRRDRPAPLVQSLVRAQNFSNLEFTPYRAILNELSRRNWFREPDEARIVDGPLPT